MGVESLFDSDVSADVTSHSENGTVILTEVSQGITGNECTLLRVNVTRKLISGEQ